MGDVINLFDNVKAEELIACPRCPSTQLEILMEAGMGFHHIHGFRCIACENTVWIELHITTD